MRKNESTDRLPEAQDLTLLKRDEEQARQYAFQFEWIRAEQRRDARRLPKSIVDIRRSEMSFRVLFS